jgi:hypothetical protein
MSSVISCFLMQIFGVTCYWSNHLLFDPNEACILTCNLNLTGSNDCYIPISVGTVLLVFIAVRIDRTTFEVASVSVNNYRNESQNQI